MTHLRIPLPNVGAVVIIGPASIGKSVLLARIERLLREEFGASAVSPDLDVERNLASPDEPLSHQRNAISRTVWVLAERYEPRLTDAS